MPPDVLLVLASSGLTFVASLMFFVSDDHPPAELDPEELRKSQVSFCLPPRRQLVLPPPLPTNPECAVSVSTGQLSGVMTLRPQGDEWVVTLETAPVHDTPAMQVRDGDGVGAVHDLRWHGQAGVAHPTRRSWKQKPGRA